MTVAAVSLTLRRCKGCAVSVHPKAVQNKTKKALLAINSSIIHCISRKLFNECHCCEVIEHSNNIMRTRKTHLLIWLKRLKYLALKEAMSKKTVIRQLQCVNRKKCTSSHYLFGISKYALVGHQILLEQKSKSSGKQLRLLQFIQTSICWSFGKKKNVLWNSTWNIAQPILAYLHAAFSPSVIRSCQNHTSAWLYTALTRISRSLPINPI